VQDGVNDSRVVFWSDVHTGYVATPGHRFRLRSKRTVVERDRLLGRASKLRYGLSLTIDISSLLMRR
jgi:hypothetical protein